MKRLLSLLLILGFSTGMGQAVMAQQISTHSARALTTQPSSLKPNNATIYRRGAARLAAVTPRSSQNLCEQFADVCLSVQGQTLTPYFNNTLRAPLIGNDAFNAGLMGRSPSYMLYPYFARGLFPVDGPGPAGVGEMIGVYVQVATP